MVKFPSSSIDLLILFVSPHWQIVEQRLSRHCFVIGRRVEHAVDICLVGEGAKFEAEIIDTSFVEPWNEGLHKLRVVLDAVVLAEKDNLMILELPNYVVFR